MQVDKLLKRALNQEFLSADEGEFLFHEASTAELMFVGNELKKQKKTKNNDFCLRKSDFLSLSQKTFFNRFPTVHAARSRLDNLQNPSQPLPTRYGRAHGVAALLASGKTRYTIS